MNHVTGDEWKASRPNLTAIADSLEMGNDAGPFGEANPRVEVPVLVNDGVRIFEPPIILEYLDEKWPPPLLLLQDPAARAAALD